MNVIEAIREKRAVRQFADKPLPKDVVETILWAGRRAQSSKNSQPWHFIVATKESPDEFQKMLNCLMEKNQLWAQHAPVLIITVATLNFHHNGKPNRHAFHDVGLAVGALVVQATALEVYLHQMAGFSPEKARQTYQIPEGF